MEREKITRFFSHPLFIPSSFKTWMIDHLATEIPNLPVSQVLGSGGVARGLDVSTGAVAASGAGTTTLYSLPIKGKQLAQNGFLEVELYVTAQSPDASNSADLKLMLGGQTLATIQYQTVTLDGTPAPSSILFRVHAKGSYTSQFTTVDVSLRDSAGVQQLVPVTLIGETTVDMSVDQTLSVTVLWAGGSSDDIITKQFVEVTIFNPIGVS